MFLLCALDSLQLGHDGVGYGPVQALFDLHPLG